MLSAICIPNSGLVHAQTLGSPFGNPPVHKPATPPSSGLGFDDGSEDELSAMCLTKRLTCTLKSPGFLGAPCLCVVNGKSVSGIIARPKAR